MDRRKTIELNQIALRKVVEEIFALVELVLDGSILRLPRILHVMAYRLLIPAESALRRLIIIAAHGLKVTSPAQRAKPTNSRILSKGLRPLSFQLYDTRKRFFRKSSPRQKTVEPHIHFFGPAPLFANLVPSPRKQNAPTRLCRRFAAFKQALENIPHHAKRMAKWHAKRAAQIDCKFRHTMRPGKPPGWRRSLALDVDLILQECHGLALYSLREAPS